MKSAVPADEQLKHHLQSCVTFKEAILHTTSCEEKLNSLSEYSSVLNEYLELDLPLLDPYDEYLIKQVISIGQHRELFASAKQLPDFEEKLKELLTHLGCMDRFYEDLGGIVGYQSQVLELLSVKSTHPEDEGFTYESPPNLSFFEKTDQVQKAVYEGIAHLDEMAELYPIGGAADRLQLINLETKEPLPGACFSFMNKTLLEWLVQDVEAREYLYYKCFGKSIQIPIAMMTSMNKQNHRYITELCEKKKWFYRDPNLFFIFPQPLVPTFDKMGNWIIESPLEVLMRPGGHGVIWQLALKEKIFARFALLKKKKALVRQINNPLSGIDDGLLSFMGVGHQGDKKFGFYSCPRIPAVQEGVNVTRISDKGNTKVISNIEYCDFIHLNQVSNIENYSYYPANTNTLFVDLAGIQQATKSYPYPGVLLNFKHIHQREVARLELTMQSLAEYFEDPIDTTPEKMETYLVVNERKKTLSAIKRSSDGGNINETPEACFFDLLANREELLKLCGFRLPRLGNKRIFQKNEVPFVFDYHPALGPMYQLIAQKIRGGSLQIGSELILSIADVDIENLHVDGTLIIETSHITGHIEEGRNIHSDETGKCFMQNVRVINDGNCFRLNPWNLPTQRAEGCRITIGRNAEFVAKNVVFKGNFSINVKDFTRLIAFEKDGKLSFHEESMTDVKPFYTYNFEENYTLTAKRNV